MRPRITEKKRPLLYNWFYNKHNFETILDKRFSPIGLKLRKTVQMLTPRVSY